MQEWYTLELISHPEHANISEKEAAKILLEQLNARNIDCLGENFESEEWGYWETIEDDLKEISILLDGILITAEVETDGENEDKCYIKYYARDGQIETVFGQVIYPKCSHELYPDPKKEYIENMINQKINEYIGERTDNDLIDCVRDAGAKIESICNYAVQFGDISADESAALRKPFYEAFNDLFFN